MKAIEIKNLKFSYLSDEKPTLEIDDFYVNEGESILLTGRSGSGKSTLVNCINGIIPNVISGELSGSIKLLGTEVRDMKLPDIARVVGTLLQDPERQVMNYNIVDEIAFGPENLRLPREEMERRINKAISVVGIGNFLERETTKLSGGELQRVALASVIAMEPKIMILDEPTSNIDPEGTEQIFKFIQENKSSMTQIIVEHKVERALPFVDRVVVINNGKIVLNVSKEHLMRDVGILLDAGIEIPEEYIYAKELGLHTLDPEIIREKIKESGIHLSRRERRNNGEVILSAHMEAEVEGKRIVDANLSLKKGQVYCIMGKNGAGKTTLIKALMDFLNKKQFKVTSSLYVEGEDLSKKDYVIRGRKIAYLPQSFDLMLVSKNVESEIYYSAKHRKNPEFKKIGDKLIEMFSLEDKRMSDPLMLSTGQRRRVCMAASLASSAHIMLMDEPTSGQDFLNKKILGEEIRNLCERGFSFLIVTHDSRFAYRYGDYIGIMENGKIVHEGTPDVIFSRSAEYGVTAPSDFVLRHSEEEVMN
ncbi:ABC transporter ATP-binding protein [Cuniculiplasma sp. SKW3]|uniref:ABC transporter ATP-binding protein n=1 Tax=Cuniculiplasma sp. SKW3 TaxID=3400170 RepID=UPI003FD5C473